MFGNDKEKMTIEQKQEKEPQKEIEHIRKCKSDEKDLKICSENDWDCAMCEQMEDSKITEKEKIGVSKAH